MSTTPLNLVTDTVELPAPRIDSVLAPGAAPDAAALLRLVEVTLRELHPGAADLPPVTLASRLDHDLGLDSLARMELLLRAERAFGVALPEDALAAAETVADLLQALGRGHPQGPAPARPPPAALAAPGTAGAPETASTLLEVLAWHVREHPGRTQVTVLQDGEELPITYGALAADAAAVAAGLQALGIAPRETVAIMLPTCPEYFGTYLGILMAGAIPVPIYPPGRPSQIEEHVLRHGALLGNARAVALVTVPEARLVARLLQARVAGLTTAASSAFFPPMICSRRCRTSSRRSCVRCEAASSARSPNEPWFPCRRAPAPCFPSSAPWRSSSFAWTASSRVLSGRHQLTGRRDEPASANPAGPRDRSHRQTTGSARADTEPARLRLAGKGRRTP